VISVVVLQSSMDLLRGELRSTSETDVISTLVGKEVTGIEAERVINIKEEDKEPTIIPLIKTEPKVSGVPVVNVCTFCIGCIQNCLPKYQSVLQKFDSREWILGQF